MHRVSNVLTLLSIRVNIIEPSCMLNPLSYLFICFRRMNHMVINLLHSSSDATSLYVIVASDTLGTLHILVYDYEEKFRSCNQLKSLFFCSERKTGCISSAGYTFDAGRPYQGEIGTLRTKIYFKKCPITGTGTILFRSSKNRNYLLL